VLAVSRGISSQSAWEERDGSVTVEWSSDGDSGHLRVWFDPDDHVTEVQLRRDDMRPSALGRFAWGRWLAVADAYHRYSAATVLADPPSWKTPKGKRVRQAMNDAASGKRVRPQTAETKRPGRRGHPDEHYREVADFYRERRRQGSISPTRDVAINPKWTWAPAHVTRNTAAGWVRVAREKGFLARAHRGRPG
jgi:hypothetical protein